MESPDEFEDIEDEYEEDYGHQAESEVMGELEKESESTDYPVEVMSTDQIVQYMIKCIQEVNTIVQLPPTVMRILLNHFRWDQDKLLEAYYGGDQDKLFREAKVINPDASRAVNVSSSSGDEECEICFMEMPSLMMHGMECGHRFCKHCWESYLSAKIMEEGVGETISCAAHKCPILVYDETVMKLVTDPKVKIKYQQLITNSLVQCNKLMRWCPSVDCTNAIRVQWIDVDKQCLSVTCACNHAFCFRCGNNRHDPVNCELLKKWLKKLTDESETSNWLAAFTKNCPKCSTPIEKNGGCNHMVCTNKSCYAQFCWMCLKINSSHSFGPGHHECNRYLEGRTMEAGAGMADGLNGKKAQESRASLDRYFFYHTRYMNHMQSLKFEKKLHASVDAKMERMQELESWSDVQFLKKAVDILCESRQILLYTYIFAFYVKKTNQVDIFEDNQRDLETATEILSGYLERDVPHEEFLENKLQVQDKSRYCASRSKVLLDHANEGYEKDWWTFNCV